MQDVIILQNENKMKAAPGQNVKVSLPKAFKINKQQTKSLAVTGVPSDISDSEFKEFLGLNKINFAQAERLKSKKDGRVLPIFRLEISDPTETEALFSQNLVCHLTGIVYTRWRNFEPPFPLCSATTANVSDIQQKLEGQNRNV